VIAPDDRAARRRRRRRAVAIRWGVRVAVALVLFAAGIAVGEALHDNPKPGGTITSVSTVHAP
jgi:hypothetical protein